MPKQVLPEKSDFTVISRMLNQWGFREFSDEFWKRLRHLSLKAPRPRPGRETGFTFSANGLTVIVWTTWLEEQKIARPKDAALILIIENNKVRYFSHPIHRTKNFVKNLLNQAWIARWRVLHRPLCPVCRQFMKIAFGKGIKSRYWCCPKDKRRFNWDINLPPKAKRYLKNLRRRRAKYRRERRQQGKQVHVAIKIRKPWHWR